MDRETLLALGEHPKDVDRVLARMVHDDDQPDADASAATNESTPDDRL